MVRLTRVLAAIAVLTAGAATLAAGESRLSLVPWRVLDLSTPVDAPLVLFWIPASSEELRRSELLTSYDLTLFSSRCVAMRVVRFNDTSRLTSLEVGADVPTAVLTDRDGTILGRVGSEDGELPVTEVEELVAAELERREGDAESMLDRARDYADEGDREAALALYRRVWDERCVCPRQARDAKRALKKLDRR
ncbi:MAG TPA: hypothetical protein VE010_13130 [Thermoanaerobaculia bacterium]|nr:hypothetical protein [Thermoanaerobaculia bacterium]